ncbi:MAG: FecR domain-containing protein [Nevskiales bacterium]|nr:FecR domain-containing protein [Nevskiales bacterium]
MSTRVAVLLGVCQLVFSSVLFAAAPAAGEVTLLTGRGTALAADGTVRDLARGHSVYPGEIVSSGVNSYLNLKFTDGGLMLLRPNTRFQIEDYAYRAPVAPSPATAPAAGAPAATAPASSRAFFKLLRGGFRTVTGLIGRTDQNQYRVSTPVATIGIRGTDYLVVLCDAACNTDPVIQTNLPTGGDAQGGVVVGVISGGVFVANTAGDGLNLGADQYLVTLPDGTLVKLPFEPKFLDVDPIPNPKSCQ